MSSLSVRPPRAAVDTSVSGSLPAAAASTCETASANACVSAHVTAATWRGCAKSRWTTPLPRSDCDGDRDGYGDGGGHPEKRRLELKRSGQPAKIGSTASHSPTSPVTSAATFAASWRRTWWCFAPRVPERASSTRSPSRCPTRRPSQLQP